MPTPNENPSKNHESTKKSPKQTNRLKGVCYIQTRAKIERLKLIQPNLPKNFAQLSRQIKAHLGNYTNEDLNRIVRTDGTSLNRLMRNLGLLQHYPRSQNQRTPFWMPLYRAMGITPIDRMRRGYYKIPHPELEHRRFFRKNRLRDRQRRAVINGLMYVIRALQLCIGEPTKPKLPQKSAPDQKSTPKQPKTRPQQQTKQPQKSAPQPQTTKKESIKPKSPEKKKPFDFSKLTAQQAEKMIRENKLTELLKNFDKFKEKPFTKNILRTITRLKPKLIVPYITQILNQPYGKEVMKEFVMADIKLFFKNFSKIINTPHERDLVSTALNFNGLVTFTNLHLWQNRPYTTHLIEGNILAYPSNIIRIVLNKKIPTGSRKFLIKILLQVRPTFYLEYAEKFSKSYPAEFRNAILDIAAQSKIKNAQVPIFANYYQLPDAISNLPDAEKVFKLIAITSETEIFALLPHITNQKYFESVFITNLKNSTPEKITSFIYLNPSLLKNHPNLINIIARHKPAVIFYALNTIRKIAKNNTDIIIATAAQNLSKKNPEIAIKAFKYYQHLPHASAIKLAAYKEAAKKSNLVPQILRLPDISIWLDHKTLANAAAANPEAVLSQIKSLSYTRFLNNIRFHQIAEIAAKKNPYQAIKYYDFWKELPQITQAQPTLTQIQKIFNHPQKEKLIALSHKIFEENKTIKQLEPLMKDETKLQKELCKDASEIYLPFAEAYLKKRLQTKTTSLKAAPETAKQLSTYSHQELYLAMHFAQNKISKPVFSQMVKLWVEKRKQQKIKWDFEKMDTSRFPFSDFIEKCRNNDSIKTLIETASATGQKTIIEYIYNSFSKTSFTLQQLQIVKQITTTQNGHKLLKQAGFKSQRLLEQNIEQNSPKIKAIITGLLNGSLLADAISNISTTQSNKAVQLAETIINFHTSCTPEQSKILQKALKSAYDKLSNDKGSKHLLGGIASKISAKALVHKKWFKEMAAKYSLKDTNFETLKKSLLFTNNINIQRHYFYNDDDGRSSLATFIKMAKKEGFKIIKGTNHHSTYYLLEKKQNGKTIKIYANKHNHEEDGNRDIQAAIGNQKIHINVHRGHSYHVHSTINLMKKNQSKSPITYVGSCTGTDFVTTIKAYNPSTHTIHTSGTGTKLINNHILKHLNRELLAKNPNINWRNFWEITENKYRNNEQFQEYQGPHQSGNPQEYLRLKLAEFYRRGRPNPSIPIKPIPKETKKIKELQAETLKQYKKNEAETKQESKAESQKIKTRTTKIQSEISKLRTRIESTSKKNNKARKARALEAKLAPNGNSFELSAYGKKIKIGIVELNGKTEYFIPDFDFKTNSISKISQIALIFMRIAQLTKNKKFNSNEPFYFGKRLLGKRALYFNNGTFRDTQLVLSKTLTKLGIGHKRYEKKIIDYIKKMYYTIS